MAPSFANMPPHARAAFIAAQLDALTGPTEPSVNPLPAEEEPAPKKRKLTAARRAKANMRASKLSRRVSIQDEREASFEHHRRKCQVCNHPEREAIEELFINWHSPRTIRGEFGIYPKLDWFSIYRHARAVGLYEKRRKNLRAVFDLVLEHAAGIAPTAQGIVSIVRGYSCLTDTHEWVEPERRVHVVNHVYRHDVPAPSPADSHLALAVSGAPSFALGLRPAAQNEEVAKGGIPFAPSSAQNSAAPTCPDERRAVPGVSVPAPVFPVCTDKVENSSSFRAPHPPVLSEVEGRDVVGSDSLPASAVPHSPAPVLATSHSPLATRISNRNTPEIRIASNSHITNDGRISNRNISHPVSTTLQGKKSPRSPLESCKARKDKLDG